MNICKLFSKITESKKGPLFKDIIGYNDIKRLFRMGLDSDDQSHTLLSGPPASAKTMFLESLRKLKSSYFSSCPCSVNTTALPTSVELELELELELICNFSNLISQWSLIKRQD
jgi:hypothetical protein